MNTVTPKITVLMPAYNAGKYIGEAITSVLKQSFADFELLIVNDGSTDNTLNVINSFADPRIVVIHQQNKGIVSALNNGLTQARAAYIARFDADDVCYPNRLKTQYNFITAHPEYQIIGSAADYIDADGNYIFTQHPVAHLYEEIQDLPPSICPFIHPCVFYRKETILKYGGYNEHAYTFEDHYLWANILKTEKACNLSQPLIKHRLNPESITIDEKWRPRRFREIKYKALQTLTINRTDEQELRSIVAGQDLPKIKEGAYYALCGKKYLVNNFQPRKARNSVLKAICAHPARIDNYLLYLASYFPESIIRWLNKPSLPGAKVSL